jgi:ubiquinone/menaquinone biosynthesis C-methylase UbiE
MMPNRAGAHAPGILRLAGVMTMVLACAGSAAAQLASRPAEEWVKVLDSPERLKGLKIHEVAASLELSEGDVVADLGAGTGPFVVPFAAHVKDKGKVYAVDIDRGFFPHIERRAKEAGVTNVQTVLGEPTDPKLPAADVDMAFFHDVLHHVENRAAYLKNLVKYLKPDARIAVIEYNPAQSPHRDEPALQVSKTQTSAWLAEAGFKPLYEIPLFTDKWFVIYRR